ncbi:MAG: hypothetical protein KAS69_05865 [Planctomycetes bacterium]|nr:hypothetical protein [Planctomycetota bacterium]
MQKENIARVFIFVVFFGIGAAALGVSILSGDLLRFYYGRSRLEAAKESVLRLQSLNSDYDALLKQVQTEPNITERIAKATLGEQSAETNANIIYPKATFEQLAVAKETLAKNSNCDAVKPAIPRWLERCSKSPNRLALFLSGAFLILISFIWFRK